MAEKKTHKDTIVIWDDTVQLFDRGERGKALDILQAIAEPPAKILYNVGLIQLLSGKTHNAVQAFKQCIDKDQHMGIAHFQLAQTYYQQQNYNAALKSFEKASTCLRGNKFIDYKQLGLQCKLHECEVLHNWALTYACLKERQWALDLMTDAVSCKSEARHSMIDSSLAALQQGKIPRLLTVAEEHIFRPPANKVLNLKGVDYLGKAKVVSELVVPDAENKRARSPSPIPPSHAPPPLRSLPVPSPSHNFKPISSPAPRSPSPNPKSPPSRPPPMAPAGKRDSPSLTPHLPPSPTVGLSPCPSPTPGAKTTHKDSILIWNEGVLMFERGQVGPALDHMLRIADPPAKILFNIGMLQLKRGNVQEADEVFQTVISKDPHLAIGHYQLGHVQCQLNRPEQARRHYDKCLACFRGHKFIDYKQLGLPYKLYEFEVLHNQAWAYFKLGQRDECRRLLREAQGTKPEIKHDAIDNSLKNAEAGVIFDVMRLPKGALFRPPKSKLDNMSKVDFLGQATVVSSLNPESAGSISPSRVSPVNSEPFYLPMSPTSPPVQSGKPKENRVQRKSLPELTTKSLPQPPRKLTPGPPARAVNFQAGHPPGSGQDPPMPVPPRSTSLGHQGSQEEVSPSPGIPTRPIPAVPIHVLTEDSTIPRRSPPPPPFQNGRGGAGAEPSNLDRRRKVSPAFDPDQPLPSLPDEAEMVDQPSYAKAATSAQRRASPAPPSKPLPPSPLGNSPVSGRRVSGPPDKPVPQSPNRFSPGFPMRTPPPLPGEAASPQEQRKRSASPLPPTVPLPPPPPGKGIASQPKIKNSRDANGRSPGAARRISQEALRKRDPPAVKKFNSQPGVTEYMVAILSYIGADDKELSFSKGEIIKQCRQVGAGVLEGECGGKKGRFPKSAVQKLPHATPPK